MASLMENLIKILESELVNYEQLLQLSIRKTPVIVQGNLVELEKITEEEQIVVSNINRLDQERQGTIEDIANVINKEVKTLQLSNIIYMLEKRPEEQKKLAEVHDKLKETVHQMKLVNEQNKELIQGSLEMIQFDMTIIQALKSAPVTNNYNKGAQDDGYTMGGLSGAFDAKQ